MTIRDNVPAGAPCWVDLMSSDVEKSKAFYGELFGWVADEPNPEFGGYTNFRKDGEQVAGLMAAQEAGLPDVWSVYLAVEDAAKTVEVAKAHGAQVFVEPMAVGALGTMAVLADAGGAMIGMWQPGEHRGGLVGTGGAPCHFELHTRDYDTTRRLLQGRVRLGPADGERHAGASATRCSTSAPGENAGIMDASALAARGRARALVGVLRRRGRRPGAGHGRRARRQRRSSPGEATPYGVLATAADATGAIFKLRADNG